MVRVDANSPQTTGGSGENLGVDSSAVKTEVPEKGVSLHRREGSDCAADLDRDRFAFSIGRHSSETVLLASCSYIAVNSPRMGHSVLTSFETSTWNLARAAAWWLR